MNTKFILPDMTGNLFENRSKKSEKSPDFSGTIKVDNKEYSLSLWFASDKQGKPKVTRHGGRMVNAKISEPRDGGFKNDRRSQSSDSADNINDLSFEKPKANVIDDIDTGLF